MIIVRTRTFFLFSLFLLAFLFSRDAFAADHSYFIMAERRDSDLSLFPKWNSMVGRYISQKDTPDEDCDKVPFYPCAVIEWKKLLADTKAKPFRQQLDIVNDWANAHPYVLDQINWGVEDYWETPFEFMAVNGDCEDYAIAKYYSLQALGIPKDQMRIIVVQDFNLGGIIHAILGVYDNDELLILDNQIKQVMPARKIYHYRPIYGINENWWWEYTPK
jgi:predicted transglutaminase-like cysteine proteinase